MITVTWLIYWIRTARSVFTGAGLKWLNITRWHSERKIDDKNKKYVRHAVSLDVDVVVLGAAIDKFDACVVLNVTNHPVD